MSTSAVETSIDASLSPELIAHLYPRLFSEKRLDEWQALFDERALVVRTEANAVTGCRSLIDAMPEQREYAADNDLFVEEWENVEVHRYGHIAIVKADYSLTTDREIRYGIDVLTLVNSAGGWRVVTLAYEQTKLEER